MNANINTNLYNYFNKDTIIPQIPENFNIQNINIEEIQNEKNFPKEEIEIFEFKNKTN